MSFTCQSNFGPPAGHCLRRPVSDETPVRSGPRHWGQSEAEADMLAAVVKQTATKNKESAVVVANNRDFISVAKTSGGSRSRIRYDHGVSQLRVSLRVS